MVSQLLRNFTDWARTRPDVLAAALVGSHARDTARADSDVDLMLISSSPEQYLANPGWTSAFGAVDRHQIEHYGMVTSLRVWYQDGLEVEYGITTEEWAALPLDEGTREVISGGMVILFERRAALSRHLPVMDRQTRAEYWP